ncbi:hypothetical protein [Murimonas intestini]|uniref:hypothetical protein n=1 Tax=Murimonas intestini TaxID=1337051 RepID=UPI0011DE54D9|nr:hypothetical protein [Murimonas intestini]
MKRKKIVIAGITGIAAIVLLTAAVFIFAGVNKQRKVEAVAFIYDSCGGCSSNGVPCKACKTEEEFYRKYQNLLKENNLTESVNLTVYNTFFTKYQELYQSYKEEYQITSTIQPIMFIDETILTGTEEISAFFLSEVQRDRTGLHSPGYLGLEVAEPVYQEKTLDKMVYFYMVQCPDCVEMKEYFDKIKSQIDDFDNYFLKYDVLAGENKELMKAYWQAYGKTDGLEVPALFVNGKCLVNVDEIKEYMEANIVGKEFTIQTKAFVQEK